MRGLRSTLALIVVLGGLVAYIYFVDREQPVTETEAKAKAFDVSPENIVEVTVTNAAGETTKVQRIDTSWQLVEPERLDADAAEVASMTSSLASLEVQRVVEETPTDLAQYGLDRPRIDVAFRAKDEKDVHRLLIGEKSPAGADLYAKTPDSPRVFLISAFLDTTFSKTSFDLRDKTALRFDRDRSDTFEIVSGSDTIRFTRQGTEWRMVAPVAARADFATLEGLMTRLDGAKMQRIVSSDATDLRQYGLQAPALRVTLGAKDAPSTLLVGSNDPEGLPFAKDASRPAVFTLESALVGDLRKPAGDYRRKDVFDARTFTLARVELKRGADTRTIEKTKGSDGADVWRSAGKDLDRTAAEEALSRLVNLRAASFDATRHPSLESPVLVAVVHFDDKMETVTFGRAGADVYAARSDEPGSAKLESGTFDNVLSGFDGLK